MHVSQETCILDRCICRWIGAYTALILREKKRNPLPVILCASKHSNGMQNGAACESWDMNVMQKNIKNLNNWVTSLASRDLINSSVIQDELWLASACSAGSILLGSFQLKKKDYDVKHHSNNQSPWTFMKQLICTSSYDIMSWCFKIFSRHLIGGSKGCLVITKKKKKEREKELYKQKLLPWFDLMELPGVWRTSYLLTISEQTENP